MIVALPGRGRREANSHDCPYCLARVRTAEARRQVHREACRSGALDVSLLRCPTCGLVLSAEVIRAITCSALVA